MIDCRPDRVGRPVIQNSPDINRIMCGIAGHLGRAPLPRGHVDACLDLMRRRGPDAIGALQEQTVGGQFVTLLHSRLGIIDLDARSNQPFRLGSMVLIFNGEIYNFVELRAQLQRDGHRFATDSDTEVLAKVLHSRGWQGLDACEGMWAFACYDEQTGRLLLSRDRFGEKPLYIVEDASGIYFASEVKFLFALLGRRLPINQTQLRRYLVNGYKSLYKHEETFFNGLKELPRASVADIDASGNIQYHRYWSPRTERESQMTFEEAACGVRERVIESMRLRLRSDVPLAFCMSGGIDSNSLICAAKRVLGYDVHGFTIVNEDSRYSEWDEVQHVVQEVGLKHTAVPVSTAGFLSSMRELVRQHDAPIYTITYFAHWTLMREIHAGGYRIAVSGTAADELFSGYYDHHLFYLAHFEPQSAAFAEALAHWNQHISGIVRNPFLKDPYRFARTPDFRDHIYLDSDQFASYLRQPFREAFHEERYDDDALRNRMLNELFHEAVPVILHEDDLNAMYYSVENRSPFLDRRLFEFAHSIPTRHLVRNGAAKAVLREAMRGIVPDRILDNRRKVGFNAPILDYLDLNDLAVRDELLEDGPIFEYIDRSRMEVVLNERTHTESVNKFLFYFVSAKLFLEEFAA